MQHVLIGLASKLLGVAVSTLRRWESEGRLRPSFRTIGGHRRYSFLELNALCGKINPAERKVVAYARVSSHDQKHDLERQRDRLEAYCHESGHANPELLTDMGSGLNYQKNHSASCLK
jgi:putative resolvase